MVHRKLLQQAPPKKSLVFQVNTSLLTCVTLTRTRTRNPNPTIPNPSLVTLTRTRNPNPLLTLTRTRNPKGNAFSSPSHPESLSPPPPEAHRRLIRKSVCVCDHAGGFDDVCSTSTSATSSSSYSSRLQCSALLWKSSLDEHLEVLILVVEEHIFLLEVEFRTTRLGRFDVHSSRTHRQLDEVRVEHDVENAHV